MQQTLFLISIKSHAVDIKKRGTELDWPVAAEDSGRFIQCCCFTEDQSLGMGDLCPEITHLRTAGRETVSSYIGDQCNLFYIENIVIDNIDHHICQKKQRTFIVGSVSVYKVLQPLIVFLVLRHVECTDLGMHPRIISGAWRR